MSRFLTISSAMVLAISLASAAVASDLFDDPYEPYGPILSPQQRAWEPWGPAPVINPPPLPELQPDPRVIQPPSVGYMDLLRTKSETRRDDGTGLDLLRQGP